MGNFNKIHQAIYVIKCIYLLDQKFKKNYRIKCTYAEVINIQERVFYQKMTFWYRASKVKNI